MKIKDLKVSEDKATFYDFATQKTVTIHRPQIIDFEKNMAGFRWIASGMHGGKGVYFTNSSGEGLFHQRGDGSSLKIKAEDQYSLAEKDDPEAFLKEQCDLSWSKRIKALQESV